MPATDEVVCVDGVFLFTRKEIWQQCRFDEDLLTNYHGYDIDFSLQVFFEGYKVLVNNYLLIQHFSMGRLDEHFYQAQRIIQQKWKGRLPVGSRDIKGILCKKYWYNVLAWMTGIFKEFLNNDLGKRIRKYINH